NHWWHVALYVTARGLTSSPIPSGARTFEVDFDFIDHRLLVKTSEGAIRDIALRPDRKSTRLNSSHVSISYAVFCLKKKIKSIDGTAHPRGRHIQRLRSACKAACLGHCVHYTDTCQVSCIETHDCTKSPVRVVTTTT